MICPFRSEVSYRFFHPLIFFSQRVELSAVYSFREGVKGDGGSLETA